MDEGLFIGCFALADGGGGLVPESLVSGVVVLCFVEPICVPCLVPGSDQVSELVVEPWGEVCFAVFLGMRDVGSCELLYFGSDYIPSKVYAAFG